MSRIGLLFPGEMGAAIGGAVAGEVLWASEGRSEATTQRARAAGFRDVSTPSELLAAAEVVISICPPAIAESVAEAAASAGFAGLYVEANAIAPARAQRIAAALGSGGARVVDGAVISRSGLNLYLAGDDDDVACVAALFAGSAVEAVSLERPIGAASALKMAFGGWNKIGIALAAQAHALARAYGVEEQLRSEGVETASIVRAAPKAWRWAPELDEVAETCEEVGLPGELSQGAAALYRRWSAHRDRPVDLDRLLEDLGREA